MVQQELWQMCTDAKQETATRNYKATYHSNQIEVRNYPRNILVIIINNKVKIQRRRNLLMRTTAPSMAPAINGGSATKINMVRAFVLKWAQDPQLPILLKEHQVEPLFTMVYLPRYKFIQTKIDPSNQIKTVTIEVTSVTNLRHNIPRRTHIPPTLKNVTTIITKTKCQSNVSVMKRKMRRLTTYQRVLSSFKH